MALNQAAALGSASLAGGRSSTDTERSGREPLQQSSPAGGELRVIAIDTLDAFAHVARRWDQAVAQATAPNVFMTSDWLAAWWQHFGQDRQPWFLLVEPEAGPAIGVAPLMLATYRAAGVRLRSVEFPGADVPACADHLEVMALPGREREVAEVVGHYLLLHAGRWDVATLAALPDQSPTMHHLAEVLGRRGCRDELRPSMPCPYLPLEPPWDPYDQHLRRKFRDLKKYLATVDRVGGRFRRIDTEVELGPALSELRRLNLLRVRSKGETAGLEREDFFAFITEVCRRFLRQGWLRLYTLQVGEEVIAVNLNFAFGDKVYGYMSGFDPTWTRQGIGTVLMRHAVRSSMEEGLREYDFLRGDEEYKYRWTSCQRAATTLRIVCHPWRYKVFAGGRVAARAVALLRARVCPQGGIPGVGTAASAPSC